MPVATFPASACVDSWALWNEVAYKEKDFGVVVLVVVVVAVVVVVIIISWHPQSSRSQFYIPHSFCSIGCSGNTQHEANQAV